MAVSISTPRFEHHVQALGIAETTPRISWRFNGAAINWTQSSYDLEITRGADGVPKIFHVDSEDSSLVPWPDVKLSTAESARVRARAYGRDGQPSTDWSDAATVEAGLLNTEDWQGAVPVAADRETNVNGPKQPILFRKSFNTTGVKAARLYITALGLYVAEINGKRVGDHVLAPGWQSYNARHVYDAYDVTSLLSSGENAIGVMVGEGWYAGRIAFNSEKPRNLYGDTLGVLALLTITHDDGTKETVKSDLSWKASTGPIITSEIYNGEKYNASAEIEGWSTGGLNDTEWLNTKELPAPKGRLVPADGPPIRRLEELKPQKVFSSVSGKLVVDFGQNLVGWLRLKVDGPAGTNITMVHTEVMENGEVATRPLRSATATDSLYLSGKGTQTWEPNFTFHGFRYVQITGWPNNTALDSNSVTAVVVHSDMERTGSFECSHQVLNRFHENVIWSMKGNFLGIPTDCPQRDERLGWTGDAHAFMPTSNFLFNTGGFWRGWLKDTWNEQKGDPNFITPFYIPDDGANNPRQPTAIWGDVVVGNPWALFQTTGDVNMLQEQFDGAKSWIDHGISRNEVGLWSRSSFQFADWLDPKAPAEDAGRATTHKILVADAYLIQMTAFLSNMSSVLGKSEDAAKYADDHQKLISEFRKAWVEPYDIIANVTQTALALALDFGLYTSDNERTIFANSLKEVIANNTYLVGTGFAGTQHLGPALTSINATSIFYKMLLQEKVPSWLYQVVMGGTTTWERWDSLLPDGSVNAGSMTSFNHYAFGSVADWIHRRIGGLEMREPGWKTVLVRPEPGGNITSAKASYLSPYGNISVSWSISEGEGFKMEVIIPPNSKAVIAVPGQETVEVGSGEWQFRNMNYKVPD